MAIDTRHVAIRARLAVGRQLHRRTLGAEAARPALIARARTLMRLEGARRTRMALRQTSLVGIEARRTRRRLLRAQWAKVAKWAAVALCIARRIRSIRVRSRWTRQRRTRTLGAKGAGEAWQAARGVRLRLTRARRARLARVLALDVCKAARCACSRRATAARAKVAHGARKAVWVPIGVARVGIRARFARRLQPQACARWAKVARIAWDALRRVGRALVRSCCAQRAS